MIVTDFPDIVACVCVCVCGGGGGGGGGVLHVTEHQERRHAIANDLQKLSMKSGVCTTNYI